uniref:Uncharacterized protein n=1 Tax=Tolypothrix bouteillei VB521301 TaxID=1479485 RepID=A0A0C1RH72_9CYAN
MWRLRTETQHLQVFVEFVQGTKIREPLQYCIGMRSKRIHSICPKKLLRRETLRSNFLQNLKPQN